MLSVLMSGKSSRKADKTLLEFLPAAIEVEQTPASPIGRTIIWVIVLLFTLAILWAFLGKVDIVVSAQGKIIPSEHIKQIQPLEAGKVKQIQVKEGQYVKQGQLLITLDNGQTAAEVKRLRQDVQGRTEEIARQQAFEHWIAAPALTKTLSTSSQKPLTSAQQTLLTQQIIELQSRLNGLHSEQAKQKAEQAMTQAEITKKQRILPVLTERVEALNTLQKKQYGSKLQYLELKQQLIEEEQNLAGQQARYQQLQAGMQAIQNQISTLMAEQRKTNLTQLQDNQRQRDSLQQELIKATQRNQQQQLRAPVNGYVQQLAIHTVGGVVTPAQVLMIIVPEQSKLEVEANLLNRDIGFVHEGQTAEVKVDTFNFTKYGLIAGKIQTISDDAIQDEKLGLVYHARIQLEKEGLQVENKWVKLSPGMSVVVEVKTGKRRLIEYFLSPLLRYKQESVRER